jgi:hypothetical protein
MTRTINDDSETGVFGWIVLFVLLTIGALVWAVGHVAGAW